MTKSEAINTAITIGAHLGPNSCNSEMLISFTEYELLAFANAIAEKAKEKQSWIDVSNRLPDIGETVLVCTSDSIGLGGYSEKFGWWMTGADFEDDDVSHWMPLPDKPDAIRANKE